MAIFALGYFILPHPVHEHWFRRTSSCWLRSYIADNYSVVASNFHTCCKWIDLWQRACSADNVVVGCFISQVQTCIVSHSTDLKVVN